eukprot:11010528-Alexandrium_andersonii.AAC.1
MQKCWSVSATVSCFCHDAFVYGVEMSPCVLTWAWLPMSCVRRARRRSPAALCKCAARFGC